MCIVCRKILQRLFNYDFGITDFQYCYDHNGNDITINNLGRHITNDSNGNENNHDKRIPMMITITNMIIT